MQRIRDPLHCPTKLNGLKQREIDITLNIQVGFRVSLKSFTGNIKYCTAHMMGLYLFRIGPFDLVRQLEKIFIMQSYMDPLQQSNTGRHIQLNIRNPLHTFLKGVTPQGLSSCAG